MVPQHDQGGPGRGSEPWWRHVICNTFKHFLPGVTFSLHRCLLGASFLFPGGVIPLTGGFMQNRVGQEVPSPQELAELVGEVRKIQQRIQKFGVTLKDRQLGPLMRVGGEAYRI